MTAAEQIRQWADLADEATTEGEQDRDFPVFFDGKGRWLAEFGKTADAELFAASRVAVPAMAAALQAVLAKCDQMESNADWLERQVKTQKAWAAASAERVLAEEFRAAVTDSLGLHPTRNPAMTAVKSCRTRYMFNGRIYRCPLERGHAGPHGKFTVKGIRP